MPINPCLYPNEEYTLPYEEALIASTMALMTGYVQACCGVRKDAMAGKIDVNLAALVDAPLLSPAFKVLLGALRARWRQQVGDDVVPHVSSREHSLWHVSPKVVQ